MIKAKKKKDECIKTASVHASVDGQSDFDVQQCNYCHVRSRTDCTLSDHRKPTAFSFSQLPVTSSTSSSLSSSIHTRTSQSNIVPHSRLITSSNTTSARDQAINSRRNIISLGLTSAITSTISNTSAITLNSNLVSNHQQPSTPLATQFPQQRTLNYLTQPRRSESSSQNSPPSISCLSTELLHLIISFIPSRNYRENFAQNILLSRVNRQFFACVFFKLQHEIHISSACQLRPLDLLLKQNPTKIDQIKFLTIDLDIDTLRWNANGRWDGSSFQSVIRQLRAVSHVSISLRRSSLSNLTPKISLAQSQNSRGLLVGRSSLAADLCESTGGDRPIFEQFSKAVDMRLLFQLSNMERIQLLKCHSVHLKRLFINGPLINSNFVSKRVEAEVKT